MIYRIFDFDDTLVKTDAKIIITKKDGTRKKLTSGQYAVYKPDSSDDIDVSQFDKVLINPRAIPKYVDALKRVVQKGSAKVIILTARGDYRPVASFLRDIGIRSGVKIVALDSSNPELKKNYIEKLIKKGATDIEFYDDSPKNIRAVNTLKRLYSKVNLKTYHVPHIH